MSRSWCCAELLVGASSFTRVLDPGGKETSRQSVHWHSGKLTDPAKAPSCEEDEDIWYVCAFSGLGVCDPLFFNFEHVDVEDGA